MLTVKDFTDSGYKQFPRSGLNNSDFGLQKLISDDLGKRYDITVWVYDWAKYEKYNLPYSISFAPDVQLKLQNDMHFNVEMLLNPDSTIADIESFYNDMWEKFNCQYYERWGE